jgi:MSHA biogenesis protein MshN
MSLINKMLQDLDARGNARLDGVPPEIKPVARELRGSPWRRIAAITAALVVVALGASAWFVLPLKGKTYQVQQAAAPAPAAPVPVPVPVKPEPAPVAVVELAPAAPASSEKAEAPPAVKEAPPPVVARAPEPLAAKPAASPAVIEKPQPAMAQPAPAAAEAPQPSGETTSWAVASERARAEEVRLAKRWRAEEARIATLPKGERKRAEQHLRDEQARAAVRAKADAAWLASLKRKEAAAGADTAAAPAAPAKTLGRVETTGQGAENSYRRALASLQEGRVSEAVSGLQGTLRANPKHEAARQTLVSLLIENNRGEEAMTQLQQALALDPRQPALAMLLARLQIERGKSGIDTLLRTLPYAAAGNTTANTTASWPGPCNASRAMARRPSSTRRRCAARPAMRSGGWDWAFPCRPTSATPRRRMPSARPRRSAPCRPSCSRSWSASSSSSDVKPFLASQFAQALQRQLQRFVGLGETEAHDA